MSPPPRPDVQGGAPAILREVQHAAHAIASARDLLLAPPDAESEAPADAQDQGGPP